MLIKQISVFIENKPGRLAAVSKILKENKVNLHALSIADTHDFGILRLIADEPEKAAAALKAADCTVTLTDVVAVEIEDNPGALADVVDILYQDGIDIEYMYAFISHSPKHATVILRVSDNTKATEVFAKSNIRLVEANEVYKS
ncbi:MAG: ACT domain-containing protein [Ruminococcus sp.]|jgi:hypothetical protein|nr:ACT domain-containing protein [Ruminococcus sp.]